MLKDNLTTFTEKLASNTPTPGGGGACGLVGSLAISLGEMVGALTSGKKKYVDVQEEIDDLMNKADLLRVQLLQIIEEDAKAFEPLSKAYSLDKETPNREQILQEALETAASVPFQLMEKLCNVIDILERFGQIGSKLVISDAATGACFAYGALYGASINVYANTRLMSNKEVASNLDNKVQKMLDTYSLKAMNVYNSVKERMS